MTTINRTITSQTGKKVELTVTIENAKVTGAARVNGKDCKITDYVTIQGRKCLAIKDGPAPYLPIDNALYGEIETTAKNQYRDSMTAEQIAEGELREAEAKYNRLFAQGSDNVAIMTARSEWDRLSSEYHQKFG